MPTMVEVWREEGIALGEARGKMQSLIRVLKARFRAVPPHVEKRVTEIGDLVVLESLTELAATCTTLAEFEDALR